jgi:hypothetical protein
VYSPVPREQIAETLVHLRSLFREMRPSNQKDYRAHERRELLTKNLLSNLFRTKDHPTLHAVLEVGDAFSLTLDGAHRLFGYELERIREYDLKLNSGFTHITAPATREFRRAIRPAWTVSYRGREILRFDCALATACIAGAQRGPFRRCR